MQNGRVDSAQMSSKETIGSYLLHSSFPAIVTSSDYLCKQFGPRSGRQITRHDLDPNCLTSLSIYPRFLGKFNT